MSSPLGCNRVFQVITRGAVLKQAQEKRRQRSGEGQAKNQLKNKMYRFCIVYSAIILACNELLYKLSTEYVHISQPA